MKPMKPHYDIRISYRELPSVIDEETGEQLAPYRSLYRASIHRWTLEDKASPGKYGTYGQLAAAESPDIKVWENSVDAFDDNLGEQKMDDEQAIKSLFAKIAEVMCLPYSGAENL